jgi:hypothetical protein
MSITLRRLTQNKKSMTVDKLDALDEIEKLSFFQLGFKNGEQDGGKRQEQDNNQGID